MTAIAPDALDALPPQDLDAEQRVIGSVFLDPEQAPHAILPILPSAEKFYSVANGAIFRVIAAVVASGAHPEARTVRDELERQGMLEKVGGEDYLRRLVDETPSAANAEFYARKVRGTALLRAIVTCARRMERTVHEGKGEPVNEIVSACERLFSEAVGERGPAGGSYRLGDLVTAEANRIREGVPAPGLAIGLAPLDAITNGLRAGRLTLVAGRPGHGKTSLGLHMARHVGAAQTPAAFISLEMDGEELAQAVISQEAQVSAFDMRRGELQPYERVKIADAAAFLAGLPVFVDIPPSLSIQGIRSRARYLHNRYQIGLLIVDYLQLMDGSGRRKGESREGEVSEISRGLKQLSRELKIPIVAMAQLNRQSEARTDKRPQVSDLRESGSLEQDADTVILVFRESLTKPDNPGLKDRAELIVGKNRGGPVGSCMVKFDARCTRFVGEV